MDLADAPLVTAAESLALRRVFTVDRAVYVYQLENGDSTNCRSFGTVVLAQIGVSMIPYTVVGILSIAICSAQHSIWRNDEHRT